MPVKVMRYVHATRQRPNGKGTAKVKIPMFNGIDEALQCGDNLRKHGWDHSVSHEAISSVHKHYRPDLDNWDDQTISHKHSSELEFNAKGVVKQ